MSKAQSLLLEIPKSDAGREKENIRQQAVMSPKTRALIEKWKAEKLIESKPLIKSAADTNTNKSPRLQTKNPHTIEASPKVQSLRSPRKKSGVKISFNFVSPPKHNPLVHRPQVENEEAAKRHIRHVIPPSVIRHKAEDLDENIESCFLDLNAGLDRVFKKSMESVIRTAKQIPVKDSSIRDSTNLLDGFEEE